MQAQVMRTTVNFDYNLYKQLTYEATSLGLSLSQLINLRLLNINYAKKDNSFDADWVFFRKMASKYGNFDYSKALREERDRDNE